MSFVGIRVPHETARLLSELEVPGQKDATDHFHITIIHLGDNVPIERLAVAMVAIFKVTAATQPFTVSTNRVTCFPKKVSPTSPRNEQVPIICAVESDELHRLQQRLKQALNGAGVEFEDKFPEYKPHVTIAWSPEAMDDKRIPIVEWGAHELVLWGGDEGDRRVVITFPLSLKLASLSKRVASRFVGKSPWRESPP